MRQEEPASDERRRDLALINREFVRSIVGTFANSACLGFAFYYISISTVSINILVCYLIVIVVCVLRVVDSLHQQLLGLRYSLRVLTPVAAACLLAISLVNSQYWVVFVVLLLGISWFNDIVSWSEISEHIRVNRTSPTLIISFDRFGNLAGIIAGYVCAWAAFGPVLGEQCLNPFIPCAIVTVLVFLQSFVFLKAAPYQFFNYAEEEADKQNGGKRGNWVARCEAFSQHYRLSPREREILLLLAKGRNAKYIEEALVVSNHTAKAHIYSIYRKVNVHSRQELLSTLESWESS